MEILVRGVSRTFTLGKIAIEALRNVDLVVPAGQCTALIGPSGCGKSTLLEMIMGLSPPTSGHIFVGGERVVGPPPSAAIVFQEYALMPWRTVLRNVEFPLEVRNIGRADRLARCRRQLDGFGLWEFRNAFPWHLSGGMKQRVALARALITDPDVLLLDEPFGALDAYNRHLAQLNFLRVQKPWRHTVLLVTHDIDEALLMADQVIVMTSKPGKVREILYVPQGLPSGGLDAPTLAGLRRHVEWLLYSEHVVPG